MRLVRVGTTSMTSDDFLRPQRATAAERAEDLLYELLEEDGDPVAKHEIEAQAKEAGLAWRVVQEARTRIGRIANGRDSNGITTWQLTTTNTTPTGVEREGTA